MPINTPLTNEEHVENGGLLCPFCESPNIEFGEVTVDLRETRQVAWCQDCGEEWIDLYKMVGYIQN